MNKIYFLIFFISIQSYGKTAETVVLLKEFGVNGKLIKNDVAIMNEESLMINKEKLSPIEIMIHNRHITNLASFLKIKQTEECVTGTYIHLMKFKNNIKNEEGCLEGQRFKSLKASFKALQKKWMIRND